MLWMWIVFGLVALVITLVLVVDWIRRGQKTGARDRGDLRSTAALLAAYFGTYRPEGWQASPAIVEAIERLLDVAVAHIPQVRYLQSVHQQAAAAGQLPAPVEPDNPHFDLRAQTIGRVCEALQQQTITV
jgi:hypothetical protein